MVRHIMGTWRWSVLGAALVVGGCNGSNDEGHTETDTDTDYDPPLEQCAADQDPSACFNVDESGISAKVTNGMAVLSVSVSAKTGPTAVPGQAAISLKTLEGTVIGSGALNFTAGATAQVLDIPVSGLPTDAAPATLGDYVIQYEIACDQGKTRGARSLFYLVSHSQAVLRGPDKLLAGQVNGFRVFVQDPVTHAPAPQVAGTFSLVWEVDGEEQSMEIYSGQTDALGQLNAELAIPEEVPETVTLRAVLNNGDTPETVEVPVTVKKLQNILLTTDKPLYQPGQTIHIRSLALRRPNLTPESGAEVVIEVMDAKGNKVFKETKQNDSYGIASATFKLATEVLLGTYTVVVTLGDITQEKAITVDRYTLPKYDIDLTTDKTFYAPGNTLWGTINAQYFFGRPVAGGSVTVTGQTYDVAFTTFATVTGKTDDSGLFPFELALPNNFVGQPLNDGNAFVLVQVAVTDTAGQERVIEITRPVVQSAVLPQVVPESGEVVPGVENVFYLITTDPQGTPVATNSTVTIAGENVPVMSDETGIGTFAYTPVGTETITMTVTSADAVGNTGSREFTFIPGEEGAFVLLRTDRSVYQVGDLVTVSVICPDIANAAGAFKDRVYLDIIKDGRTALMTTVPLTGGAGTYELTVSPELAGGFEIEAYYLNLDSTIMRDRKVVYVDPADGLNIDVTYDKAIYAPAEEANLRFTVTNRAGAPVAAAIGLQVVDEAVFSLMEFKPGLEKVFYELEQAIMTPQYEIHGYDMDDITSDPFDVTAQESREEAAQLLFAAAPGGTFGVFRDTYASALDQLKVASAAQVAASVQALGTRVNDMCTNGDIADETEALAYLTANAACFRDPWNTPFVLPDSASWQFTLTSLGPDETANTEDDIAGSFYFYCGVDFTEDMNGGDFMDDDVDREDDSLVPTVEEDDETKNNGGGEGVRVRKNFPETLYVNPALITDGSGVADLTIPLADSITTWRLSALASSTNGLLGSTQSGMTVFQDFFVDIDFPATLTQDDEIAVPIAVYNYLDVAQTIALTVEEESWFELVDTAEKSVEIGPGEVLGASFRIRVKEVGTHPFTVYGIGTALTDAVQRQVEVVPNGKEMLASQSGRLNGTVNYTATIPAEAIDGASKIMVKIYPGMLSQAVEGLDSLLQMPSGCFEQTSSSTYPNVMVLNYMMSSGQITPEIELKAREYVNLGYQRLLTFEVEGGGFEWFGESPAHNILTAYGLLEFSDMAKVHPVDPAIISRTQAWLASQQQADGHFEPSAGGIAEGAINAYQDDVVRTTAYLTYALSESGYTGPEVSAGIEWIKANYSTVKESYGLAMVANALVAYDPNDPAASAVLGLLHEARIEDEAGIHWTGTGESTTYGSGDVMSIEVTALVGYAMVRSGMYLEDVDGAMSYLIGNKDSFGNWETTQATILTLRLLLATLDNAASPGAATVRVYHNETLFETLAIDEATSDVLRLVDLGSVTAEGDNAIRLEIEGDSAYLYQIVTRHYMPWEGEGGAPAAGPLSLSVTYDKTELYVDDTVTATVTVTNTVPSSVAKMVLVDVGLPPGFELMDQALKDAVTAGVLQKFEKTERQLTLYIEGVVAGTPLTIAYELRALYPVAASSGKAETHPYYSPGESTESLPTDFVVSE